MTDVIRNATRNVLAGRQNGSVAKNAVVAAAVGPENETINDHVNHLVDPRLVDPVMKEMMTIPEEMTMTDLRTKLFYPFVLFLSRDQSCFALSNVRLI